MPEVLCVIPAKGCSTRLAKKNVLPLGGKPLLAHIIEKAKSISTFDTICVSTEDNEIAKLAKKLGADVPFIRPESLSHDPATIVDVVLHTLSKYEALGRTFQQVCVLLPTAPFVLKSDIQEALSLFVSHHAPALLSVTETESPPYNAWIINDDEQNILKPCFPNSPYRATKSTECPKTYRSNGAVLILEVESLKKNKGYQQGEILPFIMPQARSIDIDTELEYQFAKFLYETYSQES